MAGTFIISPISGNTTEAGGTANFTVKLGSAPTKDVTIAISSSKTSEGTVDKNQLTFTDANWDTIQTVTVTGVNDDIDDGNQNYTIVLGAAISEDTEYQGVDPNDVSVVNIDDDTAGVTITPTTVNVSEGGAPVEYTIKLTTEPTAPVKIKINVGDQLELIPDVTLNKDNWKDGTPVKVTAKNDTVVEGPHTGIITHSIIPTESAPEYGTVTIANVTATITDNDPGVIITQSGSSTDVTEAGATDTYTVVLTSEPTADVTINFNTGSQIQPIAARTFTRDTWKTAQTVIVTAVDDKIAEGTHTGTITHTASSTDTKYNGITINSVTTNITDNDAAGVTITQTGGNTNVTEGGATDTYTVVLTNEPTANVLINFNTGSQIQPIAALTFTPTNWNSAQTVTVTAVDDTVVEGSHTATIAHSIAPTSAVEYRGVSIASVTANITDNDPPPPPSSEHDFNQNGTPDLVFQYQPANADSLDGWTVYYDFQNNLWGNINTTPGWESRAVGRFDNMGNNPEIAFFNPVTSQTFIYSPLDFPSWRTFTTTPGFEPTAAVDLNSDRVSEVIYHNSSTGDNFYYDPIAGSWGILNQTPGWQPTGGGNIDTDPTPEVIFQNAEGLNYIFNPAEGNKWEVINDTPGWLSRGIIDVDRDTRGEVVFQELATGQNVYYDRLSNQWGVFNTTPDWAILA